MDGGARVNDEHVKSSFTRATGSSWSTPITIETLGDRGYYSAPGMSPDGRDLYIVYNAFTTPFRDTTGTPRGLIGVVLHADVNVNTGALSAWTSLHRGAVGDPRGSRQNNLQAEFLGTTSTPWPRVTTVRLCGMTSAMLLTARRSTPGASRCELVRRSPRPRPTTTARPHSATQTSSVDPSQTQRRHSCGSPRVPAGCPTRPAGYWRFGMAVSGEAGGGKPHRDRRRSPGSCARCGRPADAGRMCRGG